MKHHSHHMPWSARLILWLNQHIKDIYKSLHAFNSESTSKCMIIVMLGLSLSLPAAMHVVTKNMQQLDFLQHNATQINLFLEDSITVQGQQQLQQDLLAHPQIQSIAYTSKEQALAEFAQSTHMKNALDALDENPLPATLAVQPIATLTTINDVSNLLSELSVLPEVNQARLNMTWLLEIQRALHILYAVTYTLSALLLSIVVLVMHNTVRLSISHQQHQIRVMKLVGATDSFIRRPFLYASLWYGFIAGLLAWLFINGLTYVFEGMLTTAWPTWTAQIKALNFSELSLLIGIAMTLGWIASFASLKKHLKNIHPE